MTINERVKEIRKAKSLTQEEFGEKIGVSRSAVTNIEKGNRSVTDQMFRSICREFGVQEAWLRDGEEPMFQPEPVDEIEAICRKYGLNRDAQIMIEKFVALPAEQRHVILDYIRSVADAMTGETEDDAFRIEGEELARQLAEEQEAADASSASPATGSAESA